MTAESASCIPHCLQMHFGSCLMQCGPGQQKPTEQVSLHPIVTALSQSLYVLKECIPVALRKEVIFQLFARVHRGH